MSESFENCGHNSCALDGMCTQEVMNMSLQVAEGAATLAVFIGTMGGSAASHGASKAFIKQMLKEQARQLGYDTLRQVAQNEID